MQAHPTSVGRKVASCLPTSVKREREVGPAPASINFSNSASNSTSLLQSCDHQPSNLQIHVAYRLSIDNEHRHHSITLQLPRPQHSGKISTRFYFVIFLPQPLECGRCLPPSPQTGEWALLGLRSTRFERESIAWLPRRRWCNPKTLRLPLIGAEGHLPISTTTSYALLGHMVSCLASIHHRFTAYRPSAHSTRFLILRLVSNRIHRLSADHIHFCTTRPILLQLLPQSAAC